MTGIPSKVVVDYFSDVLCVWAHGGQIRLDTLQQELGERVVVRYRFMPLFADTATRLGESWADRGGFAGFADHCAQVCSQWEHVNLDEAVWRNCCPRSSGTAHVFLKAVGITLGIDQSDVTDVDPDVRDFYAALVADTRSAFFECGQDVGNLDVLVDLLRDGLVSIDDVLHRISDGEAYAALHRDEALMKDYGVLGSPTYVFDNGRQLLYGNVGYRIIEANVRELLARDDHVGEPSWC